MSKLRLSITMSLDGYVAGPDQSEESPLGSGGLELHEWFFPLKAFREMHGEEGGDVNASSAVAEERLANVGATIMGRNMFGPVRVRGAMSLGGVGGARILRFTIRCSCSPTTRASHSRCKAAPPSTSSATGSSPR
jgi:dihydrofolate reductase